ncbi:DEAD/DEAH box helicase [Corynebacterium bovis]|uniref:DEAD/DEAH box helicase n=1 Tax=Corynebacterium bovis TaxID=36808 RepID=UPI0031398074
MTRHLLHTLWFPDRGLHLWVEKVEGHAVVTDVADLEDSDLDPDILRILGRRPLRGGRTVTVATPKGRLRTLPVPTQGHTPEQALGVLSTLSAIRRRRGNGGLSPETVWLTVLYDLVRETVAAGRVMVRVQRVDGRSYPLWTISPGGRHQRPLGEFVAHAPVVLTRNGGADVIRRCADDLAHWMCVGLLRAGLEDGEVGNPFVRALTTGDETRTVPATVTRALNQWRRRTLDDASSLVLVLDEPGDGTGTAESDAPDRPFLVDVSAPVDGDAGGDAGPAARRGAGDPRWRAELGLSVNDGPHEPVVAAEATEGERARVADALRRAVSAWPRLAERAEAVDAWLRSGVWFPAPESLTGDPVKDRRVHLSLGAEDVEDLLSTGVPALQGVGVEVLVPRGWRVVSPQIRATATPVGQGPGAGRLGTEQVLSFDWDVSVDDVQLTEVQKRELLTSAATMVQINGRYVRLDAATLAPARRYFRALAEVAGAGPGTGNDRAGGGDGAGDGEGTAAGTDGPAGPGTVTVRDVIEANLLAARDAAAADPFAGVTVEAPGWIGRILGTGAAGTGESGAEDADGAGGGRGMAPPDRVEVPATVVTPLRDHQLRGVSWLAWMSRHGVGAILADDMGLGKTLQVLALLAWEREAGECTGPTLVIAPTGVLDAWEREARRHVPSLRVLVDHGSRKVDDGRFAGVVAEHDVVLTSYGTVARNPERYGTVRWGRVVADEAQNIKNPDTRQSRAARSVPADHRIALTGTPVENRLADLHSIMDFCNPGVLGSPGAFQDRLAIPVERYGDENALDQLRRLVDPFILRRLKTDPAVGLNLPEKREVIETIPLTREQAALYEAYTRACEQMLRQRDAGRKGLILAALMRIKQICNHPAHFTGDGSGLLANGEHRSLKVARLFEILGDALQDGRKCLVFTQFPSFGRMLVPELERRFGSTVPMIHGGMSRRERARTVEEFQSDDGPSILILSVRAGGTGITLTRASVVVHVDRWWNPAVEDQATDRAYRIGQDQDVTVHKLVTKGTLDERINDIISSKRDLAGTVVGAGEGWLSTLDDDIAELWRLNRATVDTGEYADPRAGRPRRSTRTPVGGTTDSHWERELADATDIALSVIRERNAAKTSWVDLLESGDPDDGGEDGAGDDVGGDGDGGGAGSGGGGDGPVLTVVTGDDRAGGADAAPPGDEGAP